MRFVCLLITIILLAARSSEYPAPQYIANDISKLPAHIELPLPPESNEAFPVLRLGSEAVTDVILDRIPELSDIAAFIYRQSKGEAQLVVQAIDEPINIWETRMSSKYIPYREHELYDCTFYPAYVGEEWNDGSRIIWYWFYPYMDSGNTFSENVLVDAIYYGEPKYNLDEWRNDDFYLRQMNLIQEALSDEGNGDTKLDSWIGSYAFSEDDSERKTMYIVTVYKVIDKFYAKIEINDSQIGLTLFATVQGNDDRIDFVYHDVRYNWFDNFTESFNQGDILFNLSKNESELHTHWETLRPSSDESDAICFYRDDNINRPVINNYENRVNFVETNDSDIQEAIDAYNEFLNGRSFILNEIDTMLIRACSHYKNKPKHDIKVK